MEEEKSFSTWLQEVPERLRRDALWRSEYYRQAMYLYDLVWLDSLLLKSDFRAREIVSQLVRSAGSICANMEEAYGRGVGTRDYLRIMQIALGEARETQGWYFRARHALLADLLTRRLDVLNKLIASLVGTIAAHKRKLRT